MAALYPSYFQKVSRAEKHLVELKEVTDGWVDSHPYEVRSGREGKRKVVRRVYFTSWPENTSIPIVAGDVVYNLRAALDHIQCALVPSNRTKVYFPILWEGVWGADQPGENAQRTEDRKTWTHDVTGAADGAIAILKKLQPPDDGGKTGETVHALRVLNVLATKDRHVKLPITAPGLQNVTLGWKMSVDGEWVLAPAERTYEPRALVKDRAELDPAIPEDAVEVKVCGTPAVAVYFPRGEADVPLVEFLERLTVTTRQILTDLSQFVRR